MSGSSRLGSVRARTTIAAALVVGVALFAVGTVVTVVLRESMTDTVDLSLDLRASGLNRLLGEGAAVEELVLAEEEDTFTQILDPAGNVVAASRNVEGQPSLANQGAFGHFQLPGVLPDHDHLRVHVRNGPAGETIVVGATLEGVDDTVGVVTTSLLFGLPSVLLLVAATTWIVVGKTLQPVEAIRAEVADIRGSELHRRVPQPRTHDEIGRLAATMNAMLDRVESSQQRQQRFVSDASHELRTPISTIRHELELALTTKQVDWPRVATTILDEDLRMQRLVDDLLWLAKHDQTLESGVKPTNQALVDLDEIAFDEARRLRTEPSHGTIDTSAIGAGQVRGNPDDLRRVVQNLVDNAHRHARNHIAISVVAEDGHVVLHVDDDGHGVDPNDRQRIFERFTRADEARARHDGGAGLGLAIANEILTTHNGTITAEASPTLRGARFSVTLPSTRGPREPQDQPDQDP